jgi:hypothetical protein
MSYYNMGCGGEARREAVDEKRMEENPYADDADSAKTVRDILTPNNIAALLDAAKGVRSDVGQDAMNYLADALKDVQKWLKEERRHNG